MMKKHLQSDLTPSLKEYSTIDGSYNPPIQIASNNLSHSNTSKAFLK